jgi:hypothetical protein
MASVDRLYLHATMPHKLFLKERDQEETTPKTRLAGENHVESLGPVKTSVMWRHLRES